MLKHRSSPSSCAATVLACALFATAMFGCGGGGGHKSRSRTGRLDFSVQWPVNRARVIPSNTQSIVVEVRQNGNLIESGLIPKPSTSYTFPELPVGSIVVTASAYASLDGSGTPLSSGSTAATITQDQTATIDLNLASNIDHLEANPSAVSLTVGSGLALTVTAKDSSGSIVLVAPTALSFSSDNPGLVAVDADGNITAGAGLGNANITVTEADSGKTLTIPVSILAAPSVSPGSASMTLRATAQFSASGLGLVNWSVQEGSSGGSVNSLGLYTAPSHKGTYHVVATSAADPSQTAIATVTVTSGGANVVVH